jgi:lipopolysaccharide biosynthesis glycosyltransferase
MNEVLACCVVDSALKNNFKPSKVYVVSNSQLELLQKLLDKNQVKLERIVPSPWNEYGVPSMINGTYTTYFKFDLFEYVPLNSNLIYLDTDTLVLEPINLNFIESRNIDRVKKTKNDALFMVPSYRPVIEKLGNLLNSNPYSYFNAGVIFYLKKEIFKKKMILDHLDKFYEKKSDLVWHDQDLFNTYFAEKIHPLSFKFNLSTGFLSKDAKSFFRMNLNEYLKLKSPVIVHASGSILLKKWKHYYFRKNFIETIETLQQHEFYSETQKLEIKKIKEQFSQKNYHKIFVNLRIILGLAKESSTIFSPEYFSIKNIIRCLLRNQ